MYLMIAKRKGNEDTPKIIVILQDNGFVVPLESDDDPINMEDLLYPKEYDENLSKYVSSAIQGLLSNPNIVKNTDSLFPEDDLYSIINRAGELALRLCYDNPLTEFVPFDQSFLKDKEECLKKFYRR